MLNVAIVGTGAIADSHLQAYLKFNDRCRIVALVDLFPDKAAQKAAQYGLQTPIFKDHAALIGGADFDVASVCLPPFEHAPASLDLLRAGKHVLVEKPMTSTAAEATELIRLAQQSGCVLQVGHIERFNPVFKYLETVATAPRFIETHRLSPYPARSTDVGVVLDLMIHDLDLVLAFVNSPVTSVDAVGIPVLSASEDIANARLRFANGCVANLTVSRVSPERMRKIRVFSGGATPSYISLDYRVQEGFIYRIARDGEEESSLLKKLLASKDTTLVSAFAGKRIVREPVPIAKDEPLKLELESFVNCVRARQAPVVSGEAAKRALDLAFEITRQINLAATSFPT
jgi:predicted dehydrogenase